MHLQNSKEQEEHWKDSENTKECKGRCKEEEVKEKYGEENPRGSITKGRGNK